MDESGSTHDLSGELGNEVVGKYVRKFLFFNLYF